MAPESSFFHLKKFFIIQQIFEHADFPEQKFHIFAQAQSEFFARFVEGRKYCRGFRSFDGAEPARGRMPQNGEVPDAPLSFGVVERNVAVFHYSFKFFPLVMRIGDGFDEFCRMAELRIFEAPDDIACRFGGIHEFAEKFSDLPRFSRFRPFFGRFAFFVQPKNVFRQFYDFVGKKVIGRVRALAVFAGLADVPEISSEMRHAPDERRFAISFRIRKPAGVATAIRAYDGLPSAFEDRLKDFRGNRLAPAVRVMAEASVFRSEHEHVLPAVFLFQAMHECFAETDDSAARDFVFQKLACREQPFGRIDGISRQPPSRHVEAQFVADRGRDSVHRHAVLHASFHASGLRAESDDGFRKKILFGIFALGGLTVFGLVHGNAVRDLRGLFL